MNSKPCFITPNLLAWRAMKEIEMLNCHLCKGKCTEQKSDNVK